MKAMNSGDLSDKEKIKLLAKIELSRRSFWHFCKLSVPSFYSDDKPYLKKICNEFQKFYETNEYDVLIMNMPPRHGKSLTATHLVEYILGRNIHEKIMTASYNKLLSTEFSKSVRNRIQEEKADIFNIVYNDIFPNT
jgi:hypothetical protein